MGCNIKWNNDEVTVQGNDLKSISTDMNDIPDMVPSIAIAAAFADGQSKFSGVGHLRYKECDRLEAITSGLANIGVKTFYDEDNLYIEGKNNIHGAEINTYNDHRIAMSFAIAGLNADGQIIKDEKCVAKSFPGFWEMLKVFY
jgi:3-phosphoshikimate 1-carboxyvinyltransferase